MVNRTAPALATIRPTGWITVAGAPSIESKHARPCGAASSVVAADDERTG